MLDDAVMRSPVGRGLLGPAVRLRHAETEIAPPIILLFTLT